MNSRHGVFTEKDYELIKKYDSMPDIMKKDPDALLNAILGCTGIVSFIFSVIVLASSTGGYKP